MGLLLSAAGLALLVVSFAVLAVLAGLAGAALAFALSAYGALGMYIWATRETVPFPWMAVARIVAVVAAASVVGALVINAAPSVGGLLASGLVYLAIVAGLGVLIDRRLAIRLVRLLPDRH